MPPPCKEQCRKEASGDKYWHVVDIAIVADQSAAVANSECSGKMAARSSSGISILSDWKIDPSPSAATASTALLIVVPPAAAL
jgi:hypothetical protein